MKVTTVQLRRIEETKKSWIRTCIVYEDIIIHENIIYMLLSNDTAYSINERGQGNWVVTGWENGTSIIERPSGRLLLET